MIRITNVVYTLFSNQLYRNNELTVDKHTHICTIQTIEIHNFHTILKEYFFEMKNAV